jgi:RNA polymerase sigma-70 factor (ECF subfamily)
MLKLLDGQAPRSEPSSAAGWPTRGEADDLVPLVARCRRGERDAIKTLVMTLGPAMLQMVRRVLGAGHPDVEDALQEATIGLVKSLSGFRGDCSTRHFACRIAMLTALKARRRGRGDDGTLLRLADHDRHLDDDGTTDGDAHDWLLASHRREALRRLLDDLPDPQAEALVLHCVAGLTLGELAAATQAPIETARSRLRLAKAALRERISLDPSLSELLEETP